MGAKGKNGIIVLFPFRSASRVETTPIILPFIYTLHTHTQMTHISDSMGVICPLGSECLEKTIKLENFYYSVKRIALNRVLLNCALKRSER